LCSIVGIQSRGMVITVEGGSKWQTYKTLIWGPLSFLSIVPKICFYALCPLAWTHGRSKFPKELVTNPECKRQMKITFGRSSMVKLRFVTIVA
jgi:hypothetical protein